MLLFIVVFLDVQIAAMVTRKNTLGIDVSTIALSLIVLCLFCSSTNAGQCHMIRISFKECMVYEISFISLKWSHRMLSSLLLIMQPITLFRKRELSRLNRIL